MSAALRSPRAPHLSTLLGDWVTVPLDPDPVVTAITLDSRRASPGALFLALDGGRGHGLDYLDDALAAGIAAMAYEPTGAPDAARGVAACRARGVAAVAVPDLAAHVGDLAARFYADPSAVLTCIGVTGTDGKTSVTRFLASALAGGGERCGVIGTLGAGFPDAPRMTGLTTPDAVTVQALLRQLCDDGATHVAMEVSSHALVQHRVAAVAFDTAVLTNLGRDHLDYHGDQAAYAEAKAQLFRARGLRVAVVNADDALGTRLAQDLQGSSVRILDYTLDPDGDAAVVAKTLATEAEGLRLEARTPAGAVTVHAPVLGRFNGANLLAVIALLVGQGFDSATIGERLSALTAVPGRMEPFKEPGRALAVVDYAHTAGALEAALAALREHTRGALWCVFGCGGERDTGKRPLMAVSAEAGADHVVITDDNPRGEDPDAIIAGIRSGLQRPEAARTIRPRAEAIARVLAEAAPEDTVLIAGKGHEAEQITAAGSQPYSDRETVARIQAGGAP